MIKVLKILEIKNKLFVPVLVVAICNVVLMVLVAVLGSIESGFVSAVSAAAPLERLGSMPMELLIHFLTYLGVSIYYIILEKRQNA